MGTKAEAGLQVKAGCWEDLRALGHRAVLGGVCPWGDLGRSQQPRVGSL